MGFCGNQVVSCQQIELYRSFLIRLEPWWSSRWKTGKRELPFLKGKNCWWVLLKNIDCIVVYIEMQVAWLLFIKHYIDIYTLSIVMQFVAFVRDLRDHHNNSKWGVRSLLTKSKLGGGFKYFHFHPEPWGRKSPNLTGAYFVRWAVKKNPTNLAKSVPFQYPRDIRCIPTGLISLGGPPSQGASIFHFPPSTSDRWMIPIVVCALERRASC